MAEFVEPEKAGVPGWMVSFGDMMTLILTFFILLVSLSKEQMEGLLAQGIGSFVIATRNFGLDGLMSDAEKSRLMSEVRVRFNLPPEEDPERRTEFSEASDLELIRARAAAGLAPHAELALPAVAVFAPDSAELTDEMREYLNLLSTTLRPSPGQVLMLEGHATDAGELWGGDERRLAYARARAVRAYLVEELGFRPTRVEARAWLRELQDASGGSHAVDSRLITPERKTP